MCVPPDSLLFSSCSEWSATVIVALGGYYIHTIRLEAHAFCDFDNRHRAFLGKQTAQEALVLRVQVLNQDERHARVRR